jgi:hypothetical protein
MINPATQLFMAQRMGARIGRRRSTIRHWFARRDRHRGDPRRCGELGSVIYRSTGRNTRGVTRSGAFNGRS